jgi:hypothetical protein
MRDIQNCTDEEIIREVLTRELDSQIDSQTDKSNIYQLGNQILQLIHQGKPYNEYFNKLIETITGKIICK